MPISVTSTDSPDRVLDTAGDFLAARPVAHNLVLTLLHARVAHPEPGRYWVAADGDDVVGVVFHSPPRFHAALTPMAPDVVADVAAAVAARDADLPGVAGEAGTAARFAGAWTEHCGAPARPVEGSRMYEVTDLVPPSGVPGRLRQAVPADRDLLVRWMEAFGADAGGVAVHDPAGLVDRRLPDGHFWIWDDGGDVSMASTSVPVCGVTRIQGVYTPAHHRRRGYAGACVAELSARVLGAGQRCVLYTDLANPTSNAIYRRMGYRAVAEGLRYEFTPRRGN